MKMIFPISLPCKVYVRGFEIINKFRFIFLSTFLIYFYIFYLLLNSSVSLPHKIFTFFILLFSLINFFRFNRKLNKLKNAYDNLAKKYDENLRAS